MQERSNVTIINETPTVPSNVKVIHDVDGSPFYPITHESAIVLKDGTLLGDKLDRLNKASELSDVIKRQEEKINNANEELKESIQNYNQLIDSTEFLVFDDDLDLPTNQLPHVIDYKKMCEESYKNFQEMNGFMVGHVDDTPTDIPLVTVMQEIVNIQNTLSKVSYTVSELTVRVNELEDSKPSNTVITKSVDTQELRKMNDNLLAIKEKVDMLDSKIGDLSQLPEGETLVSLLLKLTK